MSACMVGEGGVVTSGSEAPPGPKALIASLPRGSYTACRTVGGSKGGRILKLGFHLDRLCSSLRLLFPDLDLDGLEISPAEDESPCAASDSISLVDVPAKDALLVLFGGESRSGGQCAAEQLSLQLVQRCPGATMMSMAGLKPDVLANHSGACAIILECDQEGQAVFPASKFLRSLKALDVSSCNVKHMRFSVLGLAFSACDFSAASMGDDKFRAARTLDKKLESLGATRMVPCATSDVEVEDIQTSVTPWMSSLCSSMEETSRSDKEVDRRLKRLAMARIGRALQGMPQRDGVEGEGEGEGESDAMITVVFSPAANDGGKISGISVTALASPLHEARQPAIVEVAGEPRKNPLAKDTAWVQERAPLELSKGQDAAEVILLDHSSQSLLEGLVTNFFVLDSEGALVTAQNGVLEGHMRLVVLTAARKLGMSVKLEAPKMMHASTWKGAFLTSATRIVQPIKTIRFHGAAGFDAAAERTFESLEEVECLRHKIVDMLQCR